MRGKAVARKQPARNLRIFRGRIELYREKRKQNGAGIPAVPQYKLVCREIKLFEGNRFVSCREQCLMERNTRGAMLVGSVKT